MLSSLHSVPVLIYHSLNKDLVGSYAAVDIDVFAKQMEYIKKRNYNTITVAEYAKLLQNKTRIPKKTIVITFDDGFADNYEGFKIMQGLGLSWTLFMPHDYIDQEGYLGADSISYFLVKSKMELASHGVAHKYLLELDEQGWQYELNESKRLLSEKFNCAIETYSYPIGGFNRDIVEYVKKAGYTCACATNRGYEHKLDNYAIRRIKVDNKDNALSLFFKLSGYYGLTKKLKNPE